MIKLEKQRILFNSYYLNPFLSNFEMNLQDNNELYYYIIWRSWMEVLGGETQVYLKVFVLGEVWHFC